MEEMEMKTVITLTVNGMERELAVEPNRTLVDVIRYDLELTGTKKGCDVGECGSCTVILNGRPVNSCLVLAVPANGAEILTIEGLKPPQGLHPLQQAFVDKGAIQCGFCTPGMILSASNLLKQKPNPTEAEIRTALSGNLCRCTGYQKIVEAVQSVGSNSPANSRSQKSETGVPGDS
jgi:aerobic carbon-monoxide dehydrogenase small subunit